MADDHPPHAEGMDRPDVVDGLQMEGSWRSHQVPLANLAGNPEHLRILEQWLKSYRPEELFDGSGKLIAELAELAPKGDRRMGANPHANRARGLGAPAARLRQLVGAKLIEHRRYIERYGDDMPEIRDWRWGARRTADIRQ